MKVVLTAKEIAELLADYFNDELNPDQPFEAIDVGFSGFGDKVVAEVDISKTTFSRQVND